MHSIIVNASEVNYDTEEIIRARKDRMSMLERINYSRKNLKSKVYNKKNAIVKSLKPTRKPSKDDDDQTR